MPGRDAHHELAPGRLRVRPCDYGAGMQTSLSLTLFATATHPRVARAQRLSICAPDGGHSVLAATRDPGLNPISDSAVVCPCANLPLEEPIVCVVRQAIRLAKEGRVRSQRRADILMAAAGVPNQEIAARLNTCREVVWKWRKRFFEQGLAGLEERSRRGRPPAFPPTGGG